MKVTVVPAQITTIEDRIAGNLGLNQLLLLVAPVFIGSALYIVLPPTMHSATYKLVTIAALAFVCGLLAVRIKGKILLLWLIVILKFNLRPRYYMFNKNSSFGREMPPNISSEESSVGVIDKPTARHRLRSLTTADAARVLALIENPAANLSFENSRKGGLYVRVTEIKE
jgi:hypothetical protein